METQRDESGPRSTPRNPRRPDPRVVKRLVERARAGDHDAFEELVVSYRSLLRHILWARLHEPADVMDVLQETMLRAYRGLARFRGDCSFATWIGQIATNAANSYLERQARHHPRWLESESERHEELLIDPDTPEHDAVRAEFWAAVDVGLARLPREMRTALTLCDIHGMSYLEIAHAARCPIGTVRSRIFRARRAMGEHLRTQISDL